jgi:ABC-type Zn uptake system ZnuABC Zn-binding protein ZnuA
MNRQILALVTAFSVAVSVTACGGEGPVNVDRSTTQSVPLIVATSGIVADFTARIAGDAARVESLIPNGYDSHTYEPKPSEMTLLADADLIVTADETLNATVTGLVQLSGDVDRILDLNASALDESDFILREPGNRASANPHTWTSPVLAARWVGSLTDRIAALAPEQEASIRTNAGLLIADLEQLDRDLRAALADLGTDSRKLVVYHDAWVYFGREYGLEIVGALQAVSFAEPSAAELARMADQIRAERVRVFFGSEVFPSDVLEALEAESGARYVPDLADDRLPGQPGDPDHNYLALMRANLEVLVNGLTT